MRVSKKQYGEALEAYFKGPHEKMPVGRFLLGTLLPEVSDPRLEAETCYQDAVEAFFKAYVEES